MLSLREGYETIYLGNPSEALNEIHLDGALTSYSPEKGTSSLFHPGGCIGNSENMLLVKSEFVTRTIFC